MIHRTSQVEILVRPSCFNSKATLLSWCVSLVQFNVNVRAVFRFYEINALKTLEGLVNNKHVILFVQILQLQIN